MNLAFYSKHSPFLQPSGLPGSNDVLYIHSLDRLVWNKEEISNEWNDKLKTFRQILL